jgi:methanogenic corrinoid protein MtbC1
MSTLRHFEAQSWSEPDAIEAWPERSALEARRIRQSRRAPAAHLALKRTIEIEVIPRLIVAHRTRSDLPITSDPPSVRTHPDAAEIAELVRLVIFTDAPAALAHVDAVRSRGIPLDNVFIELLTPAARMLGELWNEDLCTFVDVTIGLSRLQQILRAVSFEARSGKARAAEALLLALPGDQHTLGALMLQDFFRRDGWQICDEIPGSINDLTDLARTAPFQLIGLSVSSDVSPVDLHALIAKLRRNALNRTCQILVGGRFFIEHPELVHWVGADATATDGRLAVGHLSSFLDT